MAEADQRLVDGRVELGVAKRERREELVIDMPQLSYDIVPLSKNRRLLSQKPYQTFRTTDYY